MPRPAPRRQYVFGYGSLLDLRQPGSRRLGSRVAHLTDHRRLWNVAMDNAVDLPGYKHYVSPLTGLRPAVLVTFLNIAPAPGCRVNGALIDVSDVDLALLDVRERNYARVDVTASVDGSPDGTVWSYAGTPAGLARFTAGQSAGRAVIASDYLDHVRSGFAALAADGLLEFDLLTPPPPCPVVDLRRVDV